MNAPVFIMDPRHPLFEPDTSARVIALLIARASGPLGTNAQYLFSLEQALRKLACTMPVSMTGGQRPCAVGRESDAGRPERARKRPA